MAQITHATPHYVYRPTAFGVTTWFLPERGVPGLRWACDAGFRSVHLDSRDLVTVTPEQYLVAAQDLGIGLGGLAVVDLEVTNLNDHATTKSCVEAAIQLATDLGVNYVYLPAFGRAEISSVENMVLMAELLTHALTISHDTGQIIATENTLGPIGLRALFDLVDDPRLRLLFDTQNPYLWGHHPPDIADEFASRIGPFVHIKDGIGTMGNRRIGDGECHVASSVQSLINAGFDGTFVLENDYRSADIESARVDQANVIALC